MKSHPISRKQAYWITYLTLLGLALTPVRSAEISPAEQEFFENKIRPILAQECYECHNSNGKAKGRFILDHRAALLKGGSSGIAIVPGNADDSLLIQAIRHEFDDLEMPKAGVLLDAPIIADFVKWVNMGAPDPRDAPPSKEEISRDTNWDAILKTRKNWWSFQPIKNPKAPATGKWSKLPIDRFVEAKLSEKNLKPSPAAEPGVLARRLHFSLTGLPPTEKQVTDFKSSVLQNPDTAINSLIDELLKSPHFGEKWARHWMDWIRYAESHGSEGDPKIDNAYLYRDYLIRALNSDIPYDQLLREHIAGDLIGNPRMNKELGINESVLGAVHWRMVFHGFAPTDALDEKVRFTDDQINVFTKAFQGLTVSCARCHDHKFDAISQADYYAMFGILGSTRPGRKLIDLPDVLTRNKAELKSLQPKIRAALATDWLQALESLPERIHKDSALSEKSDHQRFLMHGYFLARKNEKGIGSIWENQRNIWVGEQVRRKSWKTMPATKRWDLTATRDFQEWFTYGNGLADAPSESGRYTLESSGKNAVADIFPAGVFPHLLSDKHSGRFTSPDFHLDGEHDLYLQVTGSGSASARYVVQNYPRKGTVYPETVFGGKKGKDSWRWQHYDLAYWNGDDIHIEMANAKDAPLMVKPNDRSWFGIRSAILLKKGTEGPSGDSLEHIDPLFRVAGDNIPKSLSDMATLHQRALRDSIIKWAADKSTDSIALHLNAAVKEGLLPNTVTALKQAAPLIQQYRKLEAEIKSPTRVPGLDEWIGHDQALFEQGNHKKPTKAVPRRFLDAIDPSPWKTKTSGRRELADHLLADSNPFTSRVIANRIWLHLFGKGIVPTADNFGRMGESPTHPELLDFLSTKLSGEYNWSIKKLIREILMSKTWKQSSQPSSVASSDDPDNAWLSHFPVNRLEAESIRDALLSTSGSLDRSLFGPPINGKSPRRSVYVNIIRNQLDPFLSVYNAPVPFSSTGRRAVTNVPAQSLTMLNDEFVLNAASKFAESSENEKNQVKRIASMWKKALARQPLKEESEAAESFINQLRKKGQTINKERNDIQQQMSSLKDNRGTLLSTVRAKLSQALPKQPTGKSVLEPIAEWEFEGNGKDRFGKADLQLNGSARIEGGTLVLDGKGFASTTPLLADLKEKTLEAIVELATLDQRGGGVMTVQDTRGSVFDSIVFSEKRPNHWLAGSDGFRRTEDFDATPDKEAASEAVHLMIAYRADGTIQGFRNGEPYGRAYQSKGIVTFKKSESQILFGLRHGTAAGGNRMLEGKILEARLYNRALSGDEAKAAASGSVNFIFRKDVLAELNEKDKSLLKQWDSKIFDLENRLRNIGPELGEKEAWQNLAHSIYNLKEFIYVY